MDSIESKAINDFFESQEEWTSENVPPLVEIEKQLNKFVDRMRETTLDTGVKQNEKNSEFDLGELSETEKNKTAPNLKFVEYNDPLDLVDRDTLSIGNYYMKDGELVKGDPEVRAPALYSNWHGGNVDPKDLQR
jgi:hypothetical protein